MADPLIFMSDALNGVAKNGVFFYISLSIFGFECLLGTLYLLWLSAFPNLKKKGVKWLGGFYRICFFFDLFLCVTHSLYSQKFVTELSAAFLACLIKYMLLIALYGLILAHKWVLNERERDIKIVENAMQIKRVTPFEVETLRCEENGSVMGKRECLSGVQKPKIADVNIAYLRAVIRGLKSKNLTDEDRSRICDLEFSLKAPAADDCEGIKRLNGDCEYLIKKMTEYGVSI
jgi:hypothetical protein